ncbi:MAG: Gfo/Idh/MocA family oxidoreductase [Chloroflexota bacterium]
MKIGIMSFAHMHAETYIQNLRSIPNVEMIGIADEDLARGEEFSEQFDAHLYPTYQDLLAEADAVIVCSENTRHRPLVEMAAAAGVHVLCEKPLATTAADAEAMMAACRQVGVILMTAFPMRFSAPLQQLKMQLDAGLFGQPYCVSSVNQGRIPVDYRSWFVDPELSGGGALIDHIVHLADIMRWYFDCEVTSVYAQTNNLMYPNGVVNDSRGFEIVYADEVPVETVGLVMLTFENGVFATIDCSWSKPLNYHTWGGLSFEMTTENGVIAADAFSQNLSIHTEKPMAHNLAFWGSDANQAMIEEFVSAIREQREPAVTAQDGKIGLDITLAAYESVRTGMPVKL